MRSRALCWLYADVHFTMTSSLRRPPERVSKLLEMFPRLAWHSLRTATIPIDSERTQRHCKDTMLRYAANDTRVCYFLGAFVCLVGDCSGVECAPDRREQHLLLPTVYASINADAAGCDTSVHVCKHGCTLYALTLNVSTLPLPLGHTVHIGPSQGTYIFTGDIKEMWLRDSAAQAHPLVAVRAV